MPGSLPKLIAVAPERPTRESLEAVRLAEEESRIARARNPSSGISQLEGGSIASMRELYAGGLAEEALAFAGGVLAELDEVGLDLDDPTLDVLDDAPREPEPFDVDAVGLGAVDTYDPFGGLLPVSTEPPPGAAVPRLLVSAAEIAKLPMDPRAAFLLGHVDGTNTLEEIVDMCPMPQNEALELVARLRGMGVIAI